MRLALAFLLALLAAPATATTPGGGPPLNVLLLVVDSLRPDHLGCYGYPRPTSPAIDGFAARATRFTQAYANASWTAPSVASALLGLYPGAHGLDARGKVADPFLPTPLKRLAAAGWEVWGYQGTGDVFANLGFEPRDLGSQRLRSVLEWVQEPFFLWYQLKGPHLPYRASQASEARFSPGAEAPPLSDEHRRLLRGEPMIPAGSTAWDPAEKPSVEALYDAALADQDAELAEVFEKLDERQLWPRTVVVLTADHGEELLDHGEVGHASTTRAATLFDELIHIPLLIRVPGLPGGGAVGSTVTQVDIMPTLLELLGVEAGAPVQGRSLVSLLAGGEAPPERLAFSETNPCGWQCFSDHDKTIRLRAVRSKAWKLVVRAEATGERHARLFDLASDPAEQRDVAALHPEVVARLSDALAQREEDDRAVALALTRTVMERHLEALAAEPPEERWGAASRTCDEVAALLYLHRTEEPSFLDDPRAAATVDGLLARLLDALGEDATRYWQCQRLAGMVGAPGSGRPHRGDGEDAPRR